MKPYVPLAAAALALATLVWYRMGARGEPGVPLPERLPAVPREVKVSPVDAGAIAVRLAPDSGFATLRIDETWLSSRGEAVQAQVRVACRYLPEKDQWQRIAASPTRIAYRMEPRTQGEAKGEERLFYELPRESGLYWVYWIETLEGGDPTRNAVQHTELVTANRAKCGPAISEITPAGKVGACVPLDGQLETRFVADPAVACAEQR